ncbi:MAG: hypothetical protein R3F48_06470 [Candidatus Zixiibacteriota bacterium]
MKKTTLIIGLLCCLMGVQAFADSCFSLRQSTVFKPIPPMSGAIGYMANSNDRPGFIDMSGGSSSSNEGPLSLKKGLILSLLVPGAGEYYAGAKVKGQVFMGVEAAIWGGFIAYRVYGGWKKDDYRRLATAYAGVDHDGKDDVFYDMVGFYGSREEYNLYGRLYYPDRPYYPDNNSYYWQWDSDSHRQEYKRLKDDSKTAFRNSTFLLGFALVNRVVSAIDTYRTIKSANRKLKSISQIGEYRINVSPKLFGENPSVSLTISREL